MAVRVINGFPQHFDYSILRSFFAGSAETEIQTSTIINIENNTVGDTIVVADSSRKQLTVVRDGVTLSEGDGFSWLGTGVLEVTPALLSNEKVWFNFLTGSGMPSEVIPIQDPISTAMKLRTRKHIANVYTNNISAPTGADEAYVESGKTRIKTHFGLTDYNIFINGEFVSEAQLDTDGLPFWQLVGTDVVEFKTNLSTVSTNVQIIQDEFYFEE